jgi:hypothetical protein
MSFRGDNADFEAWLVTQCEVVKSGWLNTAATVAAEAVKRDYRQWRD